MTAYSVTHGNPGKDPETVTVEGATAEIDASRNTLKILDAEGNPVAGFVHWISFHEET